MSFLTHLECSSCGHSIDPTGLVNLCPECSKPLLARYDLKKASSSINKNQLEGREHSLWRFPEILPVKQAKNRLSLGEGWTKLIKATSLGQSVEHNQLFIKDEGSNATGSFKARGLGMAVSCALERGAKALSIPSAGNAAGALAAYAAKAGLKAFVFMPKDVPAPFVVECEILGAHVTLVDGLINDAGRLAAAHPEAKNRFDVSTLKEPYRIEGKKTMGYEIAEQFGWELPEVLIYPTGGGTGLIGMWKAFDEMEEMGWISSKRPRMVSVQAEGCAPMVRAYLEGTKHAEMWQNAVTQASGLRVPGAVGDFLILDAIRKSAGTALTVTDEEMKQSARTIGHKEGLFAAPEGAATFAAFEKLKSAGWIQDQDRVVLFNTGSGHKYYQMWESPI